MRTLFALVLFFFFATLTGCAPKLIYLRDSAGNAIAQGMVLAVESNIFWPNQIGIFYSNHNGQVKIPYHWQVSYYAGKESFKISWIATAEEQVVLTLYQETQTLPENVVESKSIGVPQWDLSKVPLNPSKQKYFSSTDVIILPKYSIP